MARKKKLSEAELQAKKIIEIKNENRFCPEPTRFFSVGEKVRLGAWPSPYIKEVLDDGKYYLISDEQRKHSTWFPWYNIHKLTNNQTSIIKNKDLQLSFSQQCIDSLLSKVLFFGVDFDPDYQRDFVWNDKDKEKLIQSVFENTDIGKFVFVKLPWKDADSPAYQILDGKQRLSALVDYYLNKFPYNGFFYDDLMTSDQYWFKNHAVSIAELPENISRKQILKTFILLNTAGHVVEEEQLEKVRLLLEKEGD